jgi:hypothetical protein
MSAKPTELKKLIALLDQEHPDVESLAKEVWKLVEELQATREQYVCVAWHPSANVLQAIGPYATRDRLMKDYKKRIVAVDDRSRASVALLQHPTMVK